MIRSPPDRHFPTPTPVEKAAKNRAHHNRRHAVDPHDQTDEALGWMKLIQEKREQIKD
jgi:hypothetical protein